MTDDAVPVDAVEARLAQEPLDAGDAAVLTAVRRMYDAGDPMPEGLVGRIAFGLTLDALEADIARLQRMEPALSGARGDGVRDEVEASTVTFSADRLELAVTVTPEGADRVRVDGWISPAAPAAVELRHAGGVRRTRADEDGRFVLDDVPRGSVAFVVRPDDPDASPVVTPSLTV